jgi:hypothetical protein
MIRDMESKSTGKSRGRGRPAGSVKLIANDRWRYLYAMTQTAIEKSRALGGPSALRICATSAAFKVGRPAKVGEFIVDGPSSGAITEQFQERWRRGLAFDVVHEQWDGMEAHTRAYFRGQERGDHWWDRDKFRPTAESIRTKLRLWLTAPETNPNRNWLSGMVKIMLICFSAHSEHARLAESIAASIGEGRYFAAKLRPILIKYADARRAGVANPDLPPWAQMLDLILPNYAE